MWHDYYQQLCRKTRAYITRITFILKTKPRDLGFNLLTNTADTIGRRGHHNRRSADGYVQGKSNVLTQCSLFFATVGESHK